jgi:hypothetical protein
MPGQKQHVEMYRKINLRKELLKHAIPGACYVPFCGDGDLAGQLYYKKPFVTKIFGADLNPDRIATFRQRYPHDTHLAVGDCDKWLFASDLPDEFSVCYFDSYSHPYASFKTFWQWANDFEYPRTAQRMVLFFTDGHRQGIIRSKVLIDPDNNHTRVESLAERRKLFNFYPKLVVFPWFVQQIEGWQINALKFYVRAGMLYWGTVITKL